MKTLLRPRFQDRDWGPLEFDSAAECWLQLYQSAARKFGYSGTLYHRTTVRIHGLPRANLPAVRQHLHQQFHNTAWFLDADQPDELSFSTVLTDGQEQPPAGLGLDQLSSAGLDGLMVEIRFLATARTDGPQGTVSAESTLVLIGELRRARVQIKTAWRAGMSCWEDEFYWSTPWPEEAEWWRGYDRFVKTDKISPELSDRAFTTQTADVIGRLLVKMIRVPLDGPRLPGFLTRLLLLAAGYAGLIAVGVFLAYLGAELGLPSWPSWIPVGLALFCWSWVSWQFVRNEWSVFRTGYETNSSMYQKLYDTGGTKLIPISTEEPDSQVNTPLFRKHTAELLAAGCTQLGDLICEPAMSFGRTRIRVFRTADGTTWLSLLGHFGSGVEPRPDARSWPGLASCLASSQFPGGQLFAATSGFGNGHLRKLSGSEIEVRTFPGIQEPLEFLDQFLTSRARWAKTRGLEPLALGGFTEFIRFQELHYANDCQRRVGTRYSWVDHLCWYFQIVRWSYRDR